MEFKSVLPGVKLVKEDFDGNQEELFISQNDQITVTTLDGRKIKGTFMQIEFARYTEEDDIVHMIIFPNHIPMWRIIFRNRNGTRI